MSARQRGPANKLFLRKSVFQHFGNLYLFFSIDDKVAVGKKLYFFLQLVRFVPKTLIMGRAQVGEYTYGRFYHLLKPFHLARLRDSCFQKGHLVISFHAKKRQWYADLTVIAFWTFRHIVDRA